MKVIKLYQTVAFRLTVFYSMFFTACVVLLLGFVYWQTAIEMTHRVDQVLLLEKNDFAGLHEARMPGEIDKRIELDQRHIYYYGLFGPDGRRIAGNVPKVPQDIPRDGNIYETSQFQTSLQAAPMPARALLVPLDSGDLLLLGHDVQQLVEFGRIMKRAFAFGGTLTILLGLLFGLGLSFRPLRRIRQIQLACEHIIHGEVKHRLPVTRHRDEINMLAAIVNRMLDETERLMSEIKCAGDNIAHDLRTPLTRLRSGLYRIQQQLGEDSAQGAMMKQAIADVDALLARFRALLRISEIENNQRRAGFKMLHLKEILEQAVGFFEPLAEDKSIALSLVAGDAAPLWGDGELLFEAIANLLDNAIKFTPAGGRIAVRLSEEKGVAQIDVIDTGAGIGENEKNAVLNRFYRSDSPVQPPGHGLGLSIVTAIVRLHGFRFEFGKTSVGTRATIICQS